VIVSKKNRDGCPRSLFQCSWTHAIRGGFCMQM